MSVEKMYKTRQNDRYITVEHVQWEVLFKTRIICAEKPIKKATQSSVAIQTAMYTYAALP